ncbi:glycosyltransferase family 4 protein [Streptomyces sp. NPDC050658]|uniref:glycosyltransferase family 4 protein n=1 Tax=unclassified Streptomyces TaxID=2593676 RepID=UPI0034278A40
MSGARARVVVVQPYLAGYRVPLFRRMTADLAAHGIELVVAHGAPHGDQARRADAARLEGAVPLRQRELPLPGGRTLVRRHLGELARDCDALVLEHALYAAESYAPLLRGTRGAGPRVALWGHGDPHTRRAVPLAGAVKAWAARRADWYFAYTESGRRAALRWGVREDRVTVLRNTVDTDELTTAYAAVEAEDLVRLRARHRLCPGRTAWYIGGLDAPKRIPFLLAAARIVAELLPGFRLLVAGDGAQRSLVEAAAAEPGSPVVALGTVTSATAKARYGAVSDVMLMPGRVGLCAVDSFVLGTPLVTTAWPYHSVEFDYVADGRTAVVVRGDERAYAQEVAALLVDRPRVEGLRRACRAEAARYTIDGMSHRFSTGLRGLLV